MKKAWIIGIVVLLLVVVGYFVFFRKKASSGTDQKSDYGVTKSGKTITESMIQQEMRITEGYNKATVQEKATANGRTYQEQLRLDAIWMLQNADGH